MKTVLEQLLDKQIPVVIIASVTGMSPEAISRKKTFGQEIGTREVNVWLGQCLLFVMNNTQEEDRKELCWKLRHEVKFGRECDAREMVLNRYFEMKR